jgi:hypothetical protein
MLGLPKGLFTVCLPVEILKALLPSSIQTTRPAHLNLLYCAKNSSKLNKFLHSEVNLLIHHFFIESALLY